MPNTIKETLQGKLKLILIDHYKFLYRNEVGYQVQTILEETAVENRDVGING